MVNTKPATPKEKTLATTREGWLMVAADRLWPNVERAGGKRPERFRVSCGWPSKSALRRASSKSRRIGEAWHAGSEDGAREVFVSPALSKPADVLGTLLHEMVHASLPGDAGHGPAFAAVCRKLGMAGKPTQAMPGEDLSAELEDMARVIGRYPHARLDADMAPKQKARLMLVECPSCGCKVRMTRSWIDTYLPTCGCGTTMISAEYAVDGEPLALETSAVAYRTEDGRFRLSTTRHGRRDGRWIVEEILTEDGEPSDRWTYRVDRVDALAFVAAVRAGETDFPDVDVDTDDGEDVDLEDMDPEDVDDLLGPIGEWPEDDDYVDGDETPDYPDGFLSEAEAAEYDRTAERREAA